MGKGRADRFGFIAVQVPDFAWWGRFRSLPVAGAAPNEIQAYRKAVQTLTKFGHRRIVLLARPQHRQPVLSQAAKAFVEALNQQGIKVGDYHFPRWEDTREDFHRCLESLFRTSAPTALIVQEAVLFGAVQQFLLARGIQVPRDISLVCTDYDPTFEWKIPTVAYIKWQLKPMMRHLVRWAQDVAFGKNQRRQLLTKAEFVPGGSVGPCRLK